MFKSIASLRNATSKSGLKYNAAIQMLYYRNLAKNQCHVDPTANGDYDKSGSSSGTIIVSFLSNDTMFRVLYYSIEPPCDDSPLLQSQVSFLECKCVPFPKAIQVFSLQYDPAGVPVLIAIGRDGCVYKSQTLVHKGSTDVPIVGCKLGPNIHLIGMDFISTPPSHCFSLLKEETHETIENSIKDGWMVIAGSCSLSPPILIILPHDETTVCRTIDICGLEDTYSEVTAIKVFHRSSLDRNTWGAIKCLWKFNAKGATEPIWDSIDISIAMFGYADGSVYVAIVSMGMGMGAGIEASNAVKVHGSTAPAQSIISFCLMNMGTKSERITRSLQLLCVGSLGSIFALNTVAIDESYRFSTITPMQSNGAFDPTSAISTMGLLVHAESLSASAMGCDQDLSCSILATANDGSSYLIGLEYEPSNHDDGQLSGHYCKLPLRNDIASIATLAIDGQSHATFVACLSMRRSFHFFLGAQDLLIAGYMSAFSDLQKRVQQQSSSFAKGEDNWESGELSIDKMINRLVVLDGAKDRCGEFEDLSNAIESTRTAYHLASSLNSGRYDTSDVDVQMQGRNVLRVASKISTVEGKESSPRSLLTQTDTTHIFQPLPFCSASSSSENPCRILARRSNESDDEYEPLDVFHGGVAQSNSVMAGVSNTFNAQVWNPHKQLTFKSTTISFDHAIDDRQVLNEKHRDVTLHQAARKRKQNGQLDCPASMKQAGYYGITLQHQKNNGQYFPFFDMLKKVPVNEVSADADLVSVLKQFGETERIIQSTYQMECLIAKASSTKAILGSIADNSQHAFSSVKMAIPQALKDTLFADTALYIGTVSGLQGVFAASIAKKDAEYNMANGEVDFIEIGCCAIDQSVANANIVGVQSSLREYFYSDTVSVESIHKNLSDSNTKFGVKVLKKLCSRLVKKDAETETSLEIYKKMRSLPLP